MKTTIVFLLLLILPMLTGCKALLGIDTEAAAADAEAIAAELQPLYDKLEVLATEAKGIAEQAEIARTSGDLKAWADLTRQAANIAREIDLTKADVQGAENAFNVALARFEKAKTTGDYLTGVLGAFTGILSVLGIGVPMVRRRNEAIRVTAGNIERELEDDQNKFTDFRNSQAAALSPEARAIIKKLKPKSS